MNTLQIRYRNVTEESEQIDVHISCSYIWVCHIFLWSIKCPSLIRVVTRTIVYEHSKLLCVRLQHRQSTVYQAPAVVNQRSTTLPRLVFSFNIRPTKSQLTAKYWVWRGLSLLVQFCELKSHVLYELLEQLLEPLWALLSCSWFVLCHACQLFWANKWMNEWIWKRYSGGSFSSLIR